MASRSHHLVCVSHEPETVVAFLTEIVGLGFVEHFLVPGATLTATMGWPPSEGADAWMLGDGSSGMVEVLGVPDDLRQAISPGFTVASFTARDLEATLETARSRGATVTDVTRFETEGIVLEASLCTVAGITFEFVRYG